jgi:hypothetical protein
MSALFVARGAFLGGLDDLFADSSLVGLFSGSVLGFGFMFGYFLLLLFSPNLLVFQYPKTKERKSQR